VASEEAKFGLPEVKRGVVAIQGGAHSSNLFCGDNLTNMSELRNSKACTDSRSSSTCSLCVEYRRYTVSYAWKFQFASELLLTGKTVSAKEANEKFRLYATRSFYAILGLFSDQGFSVNHVVPSNQVLSTALKLAQDIVANSPDAVQSTKRGLIISQRHNVDETVKIHSLSPESTRVYKGENIQVCSPLIASHTFST
jgi:enoyl-CoA hydratase/carnithine racemase